MNLLGVIDQIKAFCPIFEGRVAGAADYARGVADQVWLDPPAAYVIPLDEDVTANEDSTGLYQRVTERCGVIVMFDNRADRRGLPPAAQFHTIRAAVFAGLLNWNPQPDIAPRGLVYAGGSLIPDFTRARLFYQFDFAHEVTITDSDGWHLPDAASATIAEIKKTYTAEGETLAVQRITA